MYRRWSAHGRDGLSVCNECYSRLITDVTLLRGRNFLSIYIYINACVGLRHIKPPYQRRTHFWALKFAAAITAQQVPS